MFETFLSKLRIYIWDQFKKNATIDRQDEHFFIFFSVHTAILTELWLKLNVFVLLRERNVIVGASFGISFWNFSSENLVIALMGAFVTQADMSQL